MQWHVYQRPSIEQEMWDHLPTVTHTKNRLVATKAFGVSKEEFAQGWEEAKSASLISPCPSDDDALVMWIPLAGAPGVAYGFVFNDPDRGQACVVSPIALLHLGKAEQHAARQAQ